MMLPSRQYITVYTSGFFLYTHIYVAFLLGSRKTLHPLTLAFCHWIWIWIFSSFQDQTCRAMIDPRSSGYCECGGGRIIRKPGCTHGEWAEPFTCHDECAGWGGFPERWDDVKNGGFADL